MKLQVPFVQLPILFDAELMAAEVAALGESAWRAHPQKFPGNFALPLISVGGDPESDSVRGAMRPTPYLAACPYLRSVLASLGATWGRTRLMKLGPGAEVSAHADTNYYWRERVRVHVPVVTRPDVRFWCGDTDVHMDAGECWIFDTWRRHRVVNPDDRDRIHLVADTVGSEQFWKLVEAGHVPRAGSPGNRPLQSARHPSSQRDGELLLESSNAPVVMTPWEMRYHLNFLLAETAPHPRRWLLELKVRQLLAAWQALWMEFGESREGWSRYQAEIDAFLPDVRPIAVDMRLVNGMNWLDTLRAMVLNYAVSAEDTAGSSAPDEHLGHSPARGPAPAPMVADGRDPEFKRPIFIISCPRSGSTLLYEMLEQAPDLYSTGRESHGLIETIPGLTLSSSGYGSNRLDAQAATPKVASELRRRLLSELTDREGRRPVKFPVAMLEKTPKNALRIPFLLKVFPEARFIYLHREVRETLGSMIDAWKSGRFRTYPDLPGWKGMPWSLLLIPEWQSLIGKPLPEIVAAQWKFTTRQILEDLEELPRERTVAVDYGDLAAFPRRTMESLCRSLDLKWDRTLDEPPPASLYTLTPPSPDKWRRYQPEIESVLPQLQKEMAHARDFLKSRGVPLVAEAAT